MVPAPYDQPLLDRDGKPRAVRQPIDETRHLYQALRHFREKRDD